MTKMTETSLDIQKIRKDFPILNREVNGKSLIYFDNAATSQTPQQVIDVITFIITKTTMPTFIAEYIRFRKRLPMPMNRQG